jgi:DNA-binding MarR family transcriptional regulator
VPEATHEAPTSAQVAEHLLGAFQPQEWKSKGWPAGRDITIGQLRTLFTLRRQGPLSIGRVAEMFGIGAAAASGYIERIERHGLVERKHRTDDRRVVECHLTATGRRLLETLAGMRLEAVRQRLDVLTPQELADFDRLLTLISSRKAEA